MTKNAVEGADKWGAFYSSGVGASYPDENIVRLLKGKYADIPRSGRVLDVGFGTGNNLLFFAQNGFECHGIEVSEPSIARAEELAGRVGAKLKLSLLTGPELDYPDGHFDIVLSWAAVYYFGDRSLVRRALADFHRVLKPNGVLLMSVIHPNSFMVRRFSDVMEDGRHMIDRASPYDTRHGLPIFYDGSSSGWRKLLAPFAEVEEGYAECDLFVPERRDAWRLFLARKKSRSVSAT